MDALKNGIDFLESFKRGLHSDMVNMTIALKGIIVSRDSFYLLAAPLFNDERTLAIIFAYGDMKSIMKMAPSLSIDYDNVAWQREFRGDIRWRKHSIKKLAMKANVIS